MVKIVAGNQIILVPVEHNPLIQSKRYSGRYTLFVDQSLRLGFNVVPPDV